MYIFIYNIYIYIYIHYKYTLYKRKIICYTYYIYAHIVRYNYKKNFSPHIMKLIACAREIVTIKDVPESARVYLNLELNGKYHPNTYY